MKTVLVTGANGQLGQELQHMFQPPEIKFIYMSKSDLDIRDERDIRAALKEHKPDYVLNLAAFTDVDEAEKYRETANAINEYGVRLLAEACNDFNIRLIHISSDYVFDGDQAKELDELSLCYPCNYYGWSKLNGEEAIELSECSAVVIRTSWLYSAYGENFVKNIMEHLSKVDIIDVVEDQIGTPTYAYDLCCAIITIIKGQWPADRYTVFHYSNHGIVSRYDVAVAIGDIMSSRCHINPVDSSDQKVKRPFITHMSKRRIESQYKMQIPHWQTSLRRCIEVYKKIKRFE